jgi:hypothetical protein
MSITAYRVECARTSRQRAAPPPFLYHITPPTLRSRATPHMSLVKTHDQQGGERIGSIVHCPMRLVGFGGGCGVGMSAGCIWCGFCGTMRVVNARTSLLHGGFSRLRWNAVVTSDESIYTSRSQTLHIAHYPLPPPFSSLTFSYILRSSYTRVFSCLLETKSHSRCVEFDPTVCPHLVLFDIYLDHSTFLVDMWALDAFNAPDSAY